MAVREKLSQNPFYVLELPVDASGEEVERAASELIKRIGQGEPGIDFYPTPLGVAPRDEEDVREAAQRLRDPQRRVVFEFWAGLAVDPDMDVALAVPDDPQQRARLQGFDALAALGWKRGGSR